MFVSEPLEFSVGGQACAASVRPLVQPSPQAPTMTRHVRQRIGAGLRDLYGDPSTAPIPEDLMALLGGLGEGRDKP